MPVELSEKMLAAAAGWPVVHAARKLRDSGKVLRAVYEPPVIKGAVRSGSRTYGAGLRLGQPVENLCGCFESWSEGKVCAHSVAVALAVMALPNPMVADQGPASGQTGSTSSST
jgi:uncharacterized Zn finger protein